MSVAQKIDNDLLTMGVLLIGGYFLLQKSVNAVADVLPGVIAAPAKAADKAAQIITGDPYTSAGSAAYDFSVWAGVNKDAGKIATDDTIGPYRGGGGEMRTGTDGEWKTEIDQAPPIFIDMLDPNTLYP